jgi:hypothetical protein
MATLTPCHRRSTSRSPDLHRAASASPCPRRPVFALSAPCLPSGQAFTALATAPPWRDAAWTRLAAAHAQRVRASVDVPTTHPHGLPWLRKQHPTLLAAVHSAWLQRYQAGPIVPIKLNNATAVAMLDSGFTSNYNANFCIVHPAYCERLNIPIRRGSHAPGQNYHIF